MVPRCLYLHRSRTQRVRDLAQKLVILEHSLQNSECQSLLTVGYLDFGSGLSAHQCRPESESRPVAQRFHGLGYSIRPNTSEITLGKFARDRMKMIPEKRLIIFVGDIRPDASNLPLRDALWTFTVKSVTKLVITRLNWSLETNPDTTQQTILDWIGCQSWVHPHST